MRERGTGTSHEIATDAVSDKGLDPEVDHVTRTDFVRRATLQLNDMYRKGKVYKVCALRWQRGRSYQFEIKPFVPPQRAGAGVCRERLQRHELFCYRPLAAALLRRFLSRCNNSSPTEHPSAWRILHAHRARVWPSPSVRHDGS